MRLIDADALKETIATNVYPVSDVFNSRDYGMFWTGGIEKAIDEQPTIEERKTGRWERVTNSDNGIDFRCSACYRYRFHNGEMRKKYKFCPNCGAKMEVEHETD